MYNSVHPNIYKYNPFIRKVYKQILYSNIDCYEKPRPLFKPCDRHP